MNNHFHAIMMHKEDLNVILVLNMLVMKQYVQVRKKLAFILDNKWDLIFLGMLIIVFLLTEPHAMVSLNHLVFLH